MKIHQRSFRCRLSEFRSDEQGSMTVFGLFFFLFTCIIGAIAVDVSYLYTQRTHLQTAADQAGHAAIYRLWTSDDPASLDNQASAVDDARRIALYTLPRARTGGAMADEDIQIVFGDWNSSTQTFAPGVGYSAVRVETSFRGANAAASFFFRLVGANDFDVYADSVWDADVNLCFMGGFIAQGTIDMASNNVVGGKFCLVSNTAVTKNQNNIWGDFTSVPSDDTSPDVNAIVIMPSEAYEDALADGNSGNPGWTDSLIAYGPTPIPLLPRMENMMYDELSLIASKEVTSLFGNANGEEPPNPYIVDDKIKMPSYVPIDLDGTYKVTQVVLKPGGGTDSLKSLTPLNLVTLGMTGPGVYYVDCPQNGTLSIDMDRSDTAYIGGKFIEDMVIMTTCRLDFAAGSVIERGRFIVLNDSGTVNGSASISAAAGVTFGKAEPNGLCEEKGSAGVQIYTLGDASFPASFDAYGMQMVAMGSVKMASGAAGTNSEGPVDFIGSSVIAGGEITLTTQMNIKIACYSGGDGEPAESFRMVN